MFWSDLCSNGDWHRLGNQLSTDVQRQRRQLYRTDSQQHRLHTNCTVSIELGLEVLYHRRPPHPSLWCCFSLSLSTICRPELSHCASQARCRLCTYGCRAFHYAYPTVWNSLPDELRNVYSFDSFKQFLKTILFAAASVTSALEVIL